MHYSKINTSVLSTTEVRNRVLPASAGEGGERPSKTAGKSYANYEMKTTIDFLVEGQSIKFVLN